MCVCVRACVCLCVCAFPTSFVQIVQEVKTICIHNRSDCQRSKTKDQITQELGYNMNGFPFFFFFLTHNILKRLTQTRPSIVCLFVCVCVCLSVASHISETTKAIAIKCDTVTASAMRMHHVLIILTLALVQGHTDLSH